jgi:hypothetical protein
MDRCPLTDTQRSLLANIWHNVARGNLLASVRDNVAQVVTSSVADIWYSVARHVIVIQVHEVVIFCSPLPLRIKGIIDIPLIAEASVLLVRIRHTRPYILGLYL